MKKIFTLLAMMVLAIVANAKTEAVDFSAFGDGVDATGTTPVVQGIYSFVGNNGKVTLTKSGFYTGGSSTTTARHIVVNTTAKGSITVAGSASGDNTDRYIFVATAPGADHTASNVIEAVAIPEKGTKHSLTCNLAANTTYYICLQGNGTITSISGEFEESGKPQYDYSDIPDGIEPMDDYHAAIVRNGAFVEGEDGKKWWTIDGFNNNPATKQVNSKHSAIEAYAGWGAVEVSEYSLNQRQYVSAGRYQMRCSGFFRQGEKWNTDPTTSHAVIYVNDNEVPLVTLGSESAKIYANSQATAAGAFDADMYVNTLDFTLEESQEVNFGVKGIFDMPKSWCIIGGIEIVRVDGYDYEKEVDVTAQYLVNPSFENGTEEWTVEGSWQEQNNGESVKVGENYVEKWQGAPGLPAGKVYQTITVPNGTYRISAVANATGSGIYLFANDQKTEAKSPAQEISVVAKVTDGQLTLGYERSEENQANWVAVDNFRIYEVQDKNTLLEADNYVITALVAPVEGVDPAAIPEAFQKYIGVYTTTATLVGDENSLVITENAEEGLFDGFEVKGNAVAFSPEKVITLGGQKFTVRDTQNEGDSEETGELEIIPTNVKGYFFMEGADVYFKGKKVITIPTIVIRSEATDSEVVAEEQAEAPAQTVKVAENGRLLIKAAGKVFNVAGQQIQ